VLFLVQAKIRQDRQIIEKNIKENYFEHDEYMKKITGIMGNKIYEKISKSEIDLILNKLPLKDLVQNFQNYTEFNYSQITKYSILSKQEQEILQKIENFMKNAYENNEKYEKSSGNFKNKLYMIFGGILIFGIILISFIKLLKNAESSESENENFIKNIDKNKKNN